MIAHVVPVIRLRRDTTWWSYKVLPRQPCAVGSLVIIPFRGHPCLGVVWNLEKEDAKATGEILQVITPKPLVKLPHRSVIEFLSSYGLCSLSTALHAWLPTGLRTLPLSSATYAAINSYNHLETVVSPPKQHCILTPGFRPEIARNLYKKFGNSFAKLFSGKPEQEMKEWFGIASGTIQIGLGRERALWAPWNNLQRITVIEPEDIAYYHEQIPYLPLLDVAKQLAVSTNSTLTLRSFIPPENAKDLWDVESQEVSFDPSKIIVTDLKRQSLINTDLLSRLSDVLTAKQTAILLLNAHDRTKLISAHSQDRTIVPGIETIRKRLAAGLGYDTLPSSIVVGTRTELRTHQATVGLTAILSLDPLLGATTFSDTLHGIADIGHLLSYGAPCIIQTHQVGHPLVQALRAGILPQYIGELISQQRAAGQPPFGESIVLSYPTTNQEIPAETEQVYLRLAELVEANWDTSHPFVAPWRKKAYCHIIVHAPTTTRVPLQLRTYLAGLPHPWKIQRNPWYLV